ncbi:MAG: methyltransferase [Desulfuromonadaceae bacterium]
MDKEDSSSALQASVHPGETLNQLRCEGLQLIQAKKGYRFSIDPVLLANFATLKPGEHVMDMGCGCGVVALLLARKVENVEVVGVEVQEQQADRARRSVIVNGLEGRVLIEAGDIRTWVHEREGIFERVVCNPPFRASSQGRISHREERRVSRHEMHGTLRDFICCGVQLLRKGGTLSMVHLPERLTDIMLEMRSCGVEPKRMRMVHSRSGEGARLVLIEGRRHGRPGLEVEAPLYIYADDTAGADAGDTAPQRNYTAEVAGYYDLC